MSRAENGQQAPVPAPYEPPRVEQVLTPAELEQEVRYAGAPSAS